MDIIFIKMPWKRNKNTMAIIFIGIKIPWKYYEHYFY